MNTQTPNPAQTILEMLGSRTAVPRLSEAVLLIVDAQREYVDGRLPLVGIEASLAEGGDLLARARALGTPVVHILHRGGGPLFDPDGETYRPAAPLIPAADELVIEKTLASAFAGTDLRDTLQRIGRSQLIVIGYMTHNCVSSTVRAARELGYAVSVVAAATATRDLPDGRGGTIPAAVVQAGCLAGLSDTMAAIVQCGRDIPD